MTIHTGKEKVNQNNEAPTQAHQAHQAQQGSYIDGLFDNASDFSGQSDERATLAVETLNKIATSKSSQSLNQMELAFTLVDNEPAALPFIIGYNKKGITKAFFCLLLEEGLYGGPLPNEDLSIQGQQVQMDVDTSKCYDKILVSMAQSAVKACSGIDAIPNGAMVVKDGMEITNQAYLAKLYGTVESNLRSLQNQPSPNLRQIAQSNLQLKVVHDIHPGENVMDLEGNPISADFTSTMTISMPVKGSSKNPSLNVGRRQMMLAQVSATLDFIFNPVSTPKQSQFSPQQWCPAVHPMINITNCTAVDAKTKLSNETPETNLFGLLAIAQVAEKANYLSVFRRAKTEKASLGNLGYVWEPNISPAEQFVPREIPIATALGGDKKREALTVDELADRFLHDTMDFCIDIKKGSRNSWTQELFLLAALGGDKGKAANQELFDLFNGFTDGEFAKVWDIKAPMVQQNVISIHAGTYMNANGDERDIRDYDFLKLTNLYGKEASTAMVDYARTMELGGSNGEQGLLNIDARRKILKHIAQFEVQGLYDRVILAPDVLKALLIAATNTGIVLSSDGLYDPTNGTYVQGGNFRSSGEMTHGGIYQGVQGANNGNGNVGGGGYYHSPRHY